MRLGSAIPNRSDSRSLAILGGDSLAIPRGVLAILFAIRPAIPNRSDRDSRFMVNFDSFLHLFFSLFSKIKQVQEMIV